MSRGVVKSKAKFFRDRAADCARLAAVAKDERARAMLIHMAAAWVRVAESLEKTLEPTPSFSGRLRTRGDEYVWFYQTDDATESSAVGGKNS